MKIKVIPISEFTLENMKHEFDKLVQALDTLRSTRTILFMGIMDRGYRAIHDAARVTGASERKRILSEQYYRYLQMADNLSLQPSDVPSLSLENLLNAVSAKRFFERDSLLAELCGKICHEMLAGALRRHGHSTLVRVPPTCLVVSKAPPRIADTQSLLWQNTGPFLKGFFEGTKDNLFLMCPAVGYSPTGLMRKTHENVIKTTLTILRKDSAYSVVSAVNLLEQKSKTEKAKSVTSIA